LGTDDTIPFMLKVLSINPDFGLSIQSHPDSRWAKILHQRDPVNYPDDSHKPEVGVALTPVTLLLGFRSLSKIEQVLREIPAFEVLWGGDSATRLRIAADEGHQPALLKEMFARVLNAPEGVVASIVAAVGDLADGADLFARERALLQRLRRCYGDTDRGLLAIFMMNIVHVPPGEAVFIGPNCPHAYLDGDLVECMVSSDNVIRAGLTPKFKDTSTLLETVSYAEVDSSGRVTTKGMLGELAIFDLPTKDFILATAPEGTGSVSVGVLSHDAILLCVGGETQISGSARSIQVGDGGAAFLPALSGPYTITRRGAALFVATRL
jgi:mannose-6-phosphate isomerase